MEPRLTSDRCHELLGETKAALAECRERGLWAWEQSYLKRHDALQAILLTVKLRERSQFVQRNGHA